MNYATYSDSSIILSMDYQQFNQIMKIEIKKEIGWLVFMLLPLIFLLVVHFSIPLSYIIQSNPLIQDNYRNKQIILRHHIVQSSNQINSKIINKKLSKYYDIMNNLVISINQNTPSSLYMNVSKTVLNNAYLFVQNLANSSLGYAYQQQVSMWFATNITELDKLSPAQQNIYTAYSSIQQYMKSQLINYQNYALSSINNYIKIQNQSMLFQFPSKYRAKLLNLSQGTISQQYQSLIDISFKSNRTITSFLSTDANQTIQLKICSLLQNDLQGKYGITCINLDLNKLGQELSNSIAIFASRLLIRKYYLLLPIFTQNTYNYSTIYQFTPNTSYINITKFQNNFNYIQDSKTKVFRTGYGTYVFSPCYIQDGGNQNVVLYYMTSNEYLPSTVLTNNQFNINMNLYLILVIPLIAISYIISACVLKQLMNSLDDELIQLQNRCNFIVQGDINIEIPQYCKTKDIKKVYDKVRIINKLHRYSCSQYFSGHHVSKILKYREAMQFLNTLNYDISYTLQNLGQSYWLMKEYEKSIECLKQSVKLILAKIQNQHDTMDNIMKKKKQGRLSMNYRQMQLVLIRRTFCLVQSIYYLLNNWSRYSLQYSNATEDKKAKQVYIREAMDYIILAKKAFYPEYAFYAQCVVIHLFETAINIIKDNIQAAKECMNKGYKLSQVYIQNYPQITKKLKLKGSKYKNFFLKNKITPFSRMHPESMKTFRATIKSKLFAAEHKDSPLKHFQLINLLFESIIFNFLRQRRMIGTILKIKQILQCLECDSGKFQTTQFYRQIISFKGYEEQQNQQQQYKKLKSIMPDTYYFVDKDKQFIFLIDCWKNKGKTQDRSQYFEAKSCHIFDSFIKPQDRISIIKFNTLQSIKIQCNLTFKQSKQQMLKKQILEAFNQKSAVKIRQNQLFQAFEKAITRIKKLKKQKVILMFFKKIADYSEHLQYIRRKQKSRIKRHLNSFQSQKLSPSSHDLNSQNQQFSDFGNWMIQTMVQSGIYDCKVCLLANEMDKFEQFKSYFGLVDINRRLWRQSEGINKKNNLIYILAPPHKSDIDRILMSKSHDVPDNHIFLL